GHGHLVEVTLPAKDGGPLVVNVEEGPQIGELIGPPQGIDRTVAKRHPVAPRDLEHQLGLERTFDVNVQLRLRDSADQLVQRHQCGNPKRSSLIAPVLIARADFELGPDASAAVILATPGRCAPLPAPGRLRATRRPRIAWRCWEIRGSRPPAAVYLRRNCWLIWVVTSKWP